MSNQNGEKRKVTIVGAGFSGLVSAFYLSRAGFDVEIFEKSSRVGGLISTQATRHGLVETAANGFLNSSLVEDLFRSLNVPLKGTLPISRKRFIFRDGKFRRWPIGPFATLRFVWFVVRYGLARSLVQPHEGESVETWGNRVFGEEACRYLLSTGLQGIYAGQTSRMSAKLIMGRFFKRPSGRAEKPLVRGSVAPAGGMGELIEALERDLRSRGVEIHFNSNAAVSSDHPTIVATPPSRAAEFVDRERAQLLRQIEMTPVVTMTAFFNRTDERSKGFGVLFPPSEAKFLGVLKNDFIFENRGGPHSETWIRSGHVTREQVGLELLSERRRVFGLDESPLEFVVTNWPEGIPHYTLDLERAVPILDTVRDNVFLMGNYLGDLGLAKILERASRWPERLMREGKWK